MYIYTVIDLYTRMAYAKISPNLSEKGAAETIFEAQEFMRFPFKMVQRVITVQNFKNTFKVD